MDVNNGINHITGRRKTDNINLNWHDAARVSISIMHDEKECETHRAFAKSTIARLANIGDASEDLLKAFREMRRLLELNAVVLPPELHALAEKVETTFATLRVKP